MNKFRLGLLLCAVMYVFFACESDDVDEYENLQVWAYPKRGTDTTLVTLSSNQNLEGKDIKVFINDIEVDIISEEFGESSSVFSFYPPYHGPDAFADFDMLIEGKEFDIPGRFYYEDFFRIDSVQTSSYYVTIDSTIDIYGINLPEDFSIVNETGSVIDYINEEQITDSHNVVSFSPNIYKSYHYDLYMKYQDYNDTVHVEFLDSIYVKPYFYFDSDTIDCSEGQFTIAGSFSTSGNAVYLDGEQVEIYGTASSQLDIGVHEYYLYCNIDTDQLTKGRHRLEVYDKNNILFDFQGVADDLESMTFHKPLYNKMYFTK